MTTNNKELNETQQNTDMSEEKFNKDKNDASVLAECTITDSKTSLHQLLTSMSNTVALKSELQCQLCHEDFYKPSTIKCGHNFCRVCLLKLLESRPCEEAQCPSCRTALHYQASDFNFSKSNSGPAINVTLWNIVQVLAPQVLTDGIRSTDVEETEYRQLLHHVEAKWKLYGLMHNDSQANHLYENSDDMVSVRLDERSENSVNFSEEETDNRTTRYSRRHRQLTYDFFNEGMLNINRNVMIAMDDANEDGYENMRVAFALQSFPENVILNDPTQSCELVFMKMEEDELHDMGNRFPIRVDENGFDNLEEFIDQSCYNEVKLTIRDADGNVVMRRVRAAERGVVTFPRLELVCPPGMLIFDFEDISCGLHMKVIAENPSRSSMHTANSVQPVISRNFIADEAHESSIHQGRNRDDPNSADEEEEYSSEDSFIVNDEEVVTGEFSSEEEPYEFSSDEELGESNKKRRMKRKDRNMNVKRPRYSKTEMDDEDEHEDEQVKNSKRSSRKSHILDDSDSGDEIQEEAIIEVKEKQEENTLNHNSRGKVKRPILHDSEEEDWEEQVQRERLREEIVTDNKNSSASQMHHDYWDEDGDGEGDSEAFSNDEEADDF